MQTYRLRRRNRKERKFRCCACKDSFNSMSELSKHMKKQHPGFKYSCDVCTKAFATKNGKYKHMLLNTGKRFKCETCEKAFMWKCELQDHERKHTDKRAKRIICPVRGCKKDYSSKRALQRHRRDDHSTAALIVCDFIKDDGTVCGKESKSKTLHSQHYTHAHT